MKQNFYSQGKYFDKEEDLWKWSKEWQHLALDEETADRQLEILKKEIIMNIVIRGIKFKNVEFSSFLERIFHFVIKDLNSLEGK